jgi:hypothetical protein
MRIKKLNNSIVLRHGDLLVVAKLWRWLNSGPESGLIQFYRHRWDSVPGVSRVKHGRLLRHPRTTNERRAHFSNEATKEILESHGVAFKFRQKRSPHSLLNAHDDLFIRHQRSWKEHRTTQRKNAGGINRRIHSPPVC